MITTSMLKCKFFRWAGARHQLRFYYADCNNECTNACSHCRSSHAVGDGMCTHPDCQTTRLAPGCINKQCWRHCRLLRNCTLNCTLSILLPGSTALAGNLLEQLYSLSRFRFINYDDISLPATLDSTLSVPQATTSLDVDTNSNFSPLKASSISCASSSISVPRTAASTFQSLDARQIPFSSQSKMSSVPSGCTARSCGI